MPNELKILNGIDVETVLKSLPHGDHVNAMWFCNAAAALESALLAKLRGGAELPEPAYFTTKNARLWTYPEEIDQTGLELRIFTRDQLLAYGAAQRLAGRERAIEECAAECLVLHANGNYKHDTREDCHDAIMALAASPQEQT